MLDPAAVDALIGGGALAARLPCRLLGTAIDVVSSFAVRAVMSTPGRGFAAA